MVRYEESLAASSPCDGTALTLTPRPVTITEATVPLRRGTQTGKTKNGRTTAITIPDFLVAELRQHRVVVAERLLALGVKPTRDHTIARRWSTRASGCADGMVPAPFRQTARAQAHARAPTAWHRCQRQGGFEPPTPSSASLSLSTYAHLLPGADQDAEQRIDDLLSGSKRVAKGPGLGLLLSPAADLETKT